MRRFLHLLLAASLALAGCAQARTGYSPPAVGQITPPAGQLKPASLPWLLHIHGTTGYGTAFATTYRGSLGVMTAWHVVKRGTHTGQVSNLGAAVNMTFRQVDGCDVAWAPAPQLPATWEVLQIAPGAPLIGDVAAAWGYPGPDSMGTRGQIMDLDAPHDDDDMLKGKYLEVWAEARPGMSGGPVLDKDHRVIGVVALSMNTRKIVFNQDHQIIGVMTYSKNFPARIP